MRPPPDSCWVFDWRGTCLFFFPWCYCPRWHEQHRLSWEAFLIKDPGPSSRYPIWVRKSPAVLFSPPPNWGESRGSRSLHFGCEAAVLQLLSSRLTHVFPLVKLTSFVAFWIRLIDCICLQLLPFCPVLEPPCLRAKPQSVSATPPDGESCGVNTRRPDNSGSRQVWI